MNIFVSKMSEYYKDLFYKNKTQNHWIQVTEKPLQYIHTFELPISNDSQQIVELRIVQTNQKEK